MNASIFKIIVCVFLLVIGKNLYAQDVSSWNEPDTFYNLKNDRLEMISESGKNGRSIHYSYYKDNNIKRIDYYYYEGDKEFTKSTDFYPNGVKMNEYTYVSKSRGVISVAYLNGIYSEYDEKGILIKTSEFKDNKLNGSIKEYYSNGNVKSSDEFSDNKLNGVCKTYFQDGKVASEMSYENNRLMKAHFYDENGTEFKNDKFNAGNGVLYMYDYGMPAGFCKVKNGKLKKCFCD